MAGKLIKTGGNAQKTVFTMLVAILLLEFGSLTKLKKIWGLAFNASDTTTTTPTSTPTSTPEVTSLVLVQPTHPTSSPGSPVVTL